MIQFYAPEIERDATLPEGESVHCVRVLRMKEGDEIVVTDGKGNRYICEIIKSHPSHTEVLIKKKETVKQAKNYSLILAVAPTKNSERMEWMVEKAVEIGVDKIILLKCERSERKNLRTERLLKVMIAAMKQSLSAVLPELVEVSDYKDFVKLEDCCSNKYFGYCSEIFPKKEFANTYKGGDIIVMIGPEGDFTPGEVDLAIQNNFEPVTFGEKRLRTETAGVYAVCAVSVINQQQSLGS